MRTNPLLHFLLRGNGTGVAPQVAADGDGRDAVVVGDRGTMPCGLKRGNLPERHPEGGDIGGDEQALYLTI